MERLKRPLLWALATLAICAPAQADTLSASPAGPGGARSAYEVQKGDTLWNLSEHFFGDPFKWERLYLANPFIKDPHWIYPGQKLAIPGKSEMAMPEAAPSAAAPAAAPAATAAAPVPAQPASMPAPTKVAHPPVRPSAPSAKLPEKMPPPEKTTGLPEKMPPVDRGPGLDETMPPAMAGSEVSLPFHVVPLDWKPQGTIRDTGDFANAVDGEEVEVRWRRDVDLKPGSVVYVVQNAGYEFDPATRKKSGIHLQAIADLRVTKVENARRTVGVVVRARDGVQPGAGVQVERP